MKKILGVIAIVFLVASMTNCQLNRNSPVSPSPTAEPTLPHSMKGYELYSWQVSGEWYFSLLGGTNRLKTYQEVAADTVAVKGIDSIKQKLERMPKGEQVFWTTRDIPLMALPPEEVINQIKESCAKSGIGITVAK